MLEVGRTTTVDVDLKVGGVRETVDVGVTASAVDTTHSVVDAVLPSTAIEALPLNGRNFLELALLVPGNAPAPNFDPTKSNSVLISSAGQLGRGGNITIDGADNNDDVVGGPLQNVTAGIGAGIPDRDEPVLGRIRTLRFLGHQRRDQVRHRSSSAARRRSSRATARWQGLPATFDRIVG